MLSDFRDTVKQKLFDEAAKEFTVEDLTLIKSLF
jgi:hypothetical protein